MKKRSVYVLLLLLANIILGAQPAIKMEQQKKSFGTVKQGDPVTLSYPLTNTGDAPLVFDRYEVTCSCTSAILPATPVLPGQSAVITVEFKTAAAIGLQDRTVKVYSNAKKDVLKLRFRGTVEEK